MARNWRISQFALFLLLLVYGTYQFYQGGTQDEGYGRSLCGPPMGDIVQINDDDYPTIASYARKYEVKEWFIRTCNWTFKTNPPHATHIAIPKPMSLYVWLIWLAILILPAAWSLFKVLRR
ncbi:hypothetical protein KBC70_01320 [Candidatus Woesebacteria bacterium]|nr:hypothetical protein [Candidatus Woesebacteria bacterium]